MGAAIAVPAPAPPARPNEPWLAANLSLCFPGLGRWYAGDRPRGVLQGVTATGAFAVGGLMIVAPDGSTVIGMVLLAACIPFCAFSIWDAHRACRARAVGDFDAVRRTQRDAWKAAFLTRLLPGAGHVYDRRLVTGILFLLAIVALSVPEGLAWDIACGLLAGGAFLDAVLRARGRRATSHGSAVIIAAVVALNVTSPPAVSAWLRENVVQASRLASSSMAPTLERGDFVLLDMSVRDRARVGDIVRLPFPDRPGHWFLKSVFATAGDQVEFRHDGAYRNGQRVIACPTPGAALATVDFGRQGAPYRVPEGTVFVVGENYLHSNDSRFFGPLPASDIRGRAYKIYWPPARARSL